MSEIMRDIYSYTDYRKLLEDYYKEQKELNSKFSYQLFAERAGFTANSYLIDIIKGRKDLSPKSIDVVAEAMKIKTRKLKYFKILVEFTQAKTIDEKEELFDQMNLFRSKSDYKYLKANQYNYFSKWYHVVIRELLTMKKATTDPALLCKMVNPPITPKQAKESLALLKELNLIKQLPSGKFKQVDPILSTGNEIESLAVLKYQQENLKLARHALTNVHDKYRHISTFTSHISEECFSLLKKEVQKFRKEIGKIVTTDSKQDRVYQFNFQLFPTIKVPKK